MGLYIKGMEMPTSCRDCRFCNGQADTDFGVCAWCDVDGNAHDAYTMQDCPLVPVPPHGRLIEEADAIETAWMILCGLGYRREENPQLDQTVREVYATAPTVEVE